MSLLHPALLSESHDAHVLVTTDAPDMSRSAAVRALLSPKRCKACAAVIPSRRAAKRDYCNLRCRYRWHDRQRGSNGRSAYAYTKAGA